MDLFDVEVLLSADVEAIRVLRAAESLALPGWWIGAGFVRNRVWDHISGRTTPRRGEPDVDLVYFDQANVQPEHDWELEKLAAERFPGVPWEIRNQARMHAQNGDAPYSSTLDAISKWPETATSVAARLVQGRVEVVACHGIEDLASMIARPSPRFANSKDIAVVARRVRDKDWASRWPQLRIEF